MRRYIQDCPQPFHQTRLCFRFSDVYSQFEYPLPKRHVYVLIFFNRPLCPCTRFSFPNNFITITVSEIETRQSVDAFRLHDLQ
jgi:hypothetical protein